MEKSIENYIEEVKRLKQTYGNQYFKKLGLHAVLNDLSPSIDKKFFNVLKKADDFSLCTKIVDLETENESIKTIELAKYRQDFVENSGLDNRLATLIFDTYLFGFDLKKNLKIEDYKSESHNSYLFLEELIDMALMDNKLEKSEIENIFNKCQKQGLSEDDVFKQLVKTINQHNLQPLKALAEIKLRNKSILLQYDWVNEEVIKQEKLRQTSVLSNGEREKARQAALQKEQALVIQKEKELELKKKELESKENEEKRKIEIDKRKRAELQRQKRAQSVNSLLNWFIRKDGKGDSPLVWTLVILVLGVLVYWGLRKSNDRDYRENEAQELSIQLEKRFEKINIFIQDGLIDSAKSLLPNLVHPSTERSPFKPEGRFKEHYNYNEYWQLKREELRKKIDDLGIKPEKNNYSSESISINKKEKNNQLLTEEIESLNENINASNTSSSQIKAFDYYRVDDPDGWSNLRVSPKGDIIRKVYTNEKFGIMSELDNHKLVLFDDGSSGYIKPIELKNVENTPTILSESENFNYIINISNGFVELRSAPNSAISTGEVQNGTLVEVVSHFNSWVLVKTENELEGYIKEAHLKQLK